MVQHDLTANMISAAGALYEHSPKLSGWRLSNEALCSVREQYPTFDEKSCLLKTVAINSLYSTQVYAIVRVASHVARVMEKMPSDDELVPTLAEAGTGRRHLSFASKFSHFFVSDRFPIYDSAAIRAIQFHLGSDYKTNVQLPYRAFCNNLKQCNSVFANNQSLDRYLWLTGSWIRWKADNNEINSELKSLFVAYPEDLHEMLPEPLRETRPLTDST
jgi:hypothetical protein